MSRKRTCASEELPNAAVGARGGGVGVARGALARSAVAPGERVAGAAEPGQDLLLAGICRPLSPDPRFV
ncbi:hypothetical protein [Streptomyces acidiscabies]|uniref:hypothetical protein n=1 Tax=Streptomyces acidiscabies TaxID=42234 RepID=UPI0038F5EA38